MSGKGWLVINAGPHDQVKIGEAIVELKPNWKLAICAPEEIKIQLIKRPKKFKEVIIK